MNIKFLSNAVVALSFICCAAPSLASAFIYDFSTPSGTLGVSQTYTQNAVTITAYGFNNNSTPTALFGKNLGGDENGLGINTPLVTPISEHEIDLASFVQLDLANLIAINPSAVSAAMGSVTGGEAFNVYGSNVLGVRGSVLFHSNNESSFPILPFLAANRYLSFQSDGVLAESNVLLKQVSFDTKVPEPATYLILGGLMAFGLLALRQRSQKAKI